MTVRDYCNFSSYFFKKKLFLIRTWNYSGVVHQDFYDLQNRECFLFQLKLHTRVMSIRNPREAGRQMSYKVKLFSSPC